MTGRAVGRVAGKVVVITGAARGQGAAEAAALAAEGATVIATDVLDEAGAATAESIGDGVEYRHLDVTSLEEWSALAEHIAHTHGRLDGLVNNAGVAARGRLPDIDLESWDLTFRINVTGPTKGVGIVKS